MCGGPKNVTSTTSSEPPAFLLGPLTTAANAANADFLGSQGLNRQTFGAGYNPFTGQFGGFGRGAGRGFAGQNFGGGLPSGLNPGGLPAVESGTPTGPGGQNLIGQSQDLLSSTLAGDFLSPDSNPFLASTFNRAADLTQNRLASEFAGAGRNLGAALPARSEELQTLASNLFGQNFARERGIQTSALDQAQSLDPLNLLINRLAGIIPGAGGSTQSTQPVFRTGLF